MRLPALLERLPRPTSRRVALIFATVLGVASLTAGVAAAAPPPGGAVPPRHPAATAPAGSPGSAPSYNGLALTPPMGFNDWAGFECNSDMNETLFTKTADALVSLGLSKRGYKYVNIDDCWMQRTRDSAGNLQVDRTRFPHGLKWLGDYIHARGLKFGIYEDAGYKTCQGAAGSYGHFRADAELYKSFGVDYVKLDYCNQPTDKYPGKTAAEVAHIVYHEASQALLATGRPMVFSESAPAYFCCSGSNFTDIMKWIGSEGNLWRFGSDISDSWASVLTNYTEDNTPGLAKYAGPGHWNDPDMFEIGNGGLSLTEEQTQFTLWSEMAAPLLLSTDLTKLSRAELAIVANPRVIAVDQDRLGKQGTIVQRGPGYNVLAKPLSGGDVSVVLFNKSDRAREISTTVQNVDLRGSVPYQLTDLVTGRRTGTTGIIAADVPPHGTVIYRTHAYAAKNLPPSTVLSVSSRAHFAVGRPTPVTVTFTNHGSSPVRHAVVRLAVPTRWQVQPTSQTFAEVRPGASVDATFSVIGTAPPPGKVARTLTARVSYRWHGQTMTGTGTETVLTNAPYRDLAAAYNNVAVTDESNPTPGNFDGDGDSYSAQALKAAGVTPGSTVHAGGATFTWPRAAAGTPDNVVAAGQQVTYSGRGSSLAFLGSEAGADSAPVTVTYTDGTTGTGDVGFPNWCCTDPTAYGAKVAITTDHRDTPSGPANYGTSYQVFENSIPLDPGKTVAKVTLPDTPSIHLFAMSASAGSAPDRR